MSVSPPESASGRRAVGRWPWSLDEGGFPVLCLSGILGSMPDTTTIKVSVRTRDALRRLADRDGHTLDAQLQKLIRRERRRIMGAELASAAPDAADMAVIEASVSDVADAGG